MPKPKQEDRSAHVHQSPKCKIELNIREFEWTSKQKELIQTILDKKNSIILIKGPAGSSKSLTAMYGALQLLQQKKISDILFLRAALESSDSHLGYLPGEAQDKVKPYMLPFLQKMDELLTPSQVKALQADKRVDGTHIGFVRGLSWHAKGILLDEAQNMADKELLTVMTRIGQYSKMIIMGDLDQSDLPKNKQGAFERVWNKLNDEESKEMGVATFEFDVNDILRSPMCAYLVKKLK